MVVGPKGIPTILRADLGSDGVAAIYRVTPNLGEVKEASNRLFWGLHIVCVYQTVRAVGNY